MPTEVDQKFLTVTSVDRALLRRNLKAARVLIEDNSERSSDFFNISQLGDEFSLGKNAFLIRGSENLKAGSPILVEILDVNGDTIYYEIPNYSEDVSRVVSVFVLEDTPAGPCRITLLGEAETRSDGRSVPEEWEGVFNVRWEKKINVNPNIYNTNQVRFQRQPQLELIPRERNKLIPQHTEDFTIPSESDKRKLIEGNNDRRISTILYPSSFGYSQMMLTVEGFDLKREMRRNEFVIPRAELPDIVKDNTDFDEDMRIRILNVIDRSRAYVRVRPDVYEDFSKIINIDRVDMWELRYTETPIGFVVGDDIKEVDLDFSELRTLAGTVQRARIYRQNTDADNPSEFLADFEVAASELLIDREVSDLTRPNKRLGIFIEQADVDDYLTPINSTLIQDDVNLISSVNIIPESGVDENDEVGFKMDASKIGFSIIADSEYTLRYRAVVNNSDIREESNLRVFFTGEALADISEEEVIISEYEFSNTSFQIIEERVSFRPLKTVDSDGEWNIKFLVEGGNWYITDISIVPRQDEGFSPDFFTLTLGVDDTEGTFEYRADLFDIDNNRIPVDIVSNNEITVPEDFT